MLEITLAASAAFSVASAAVYTFVGVRLGRRQAVKPAAQVALHLFAAWWLALAGATLVGAVQTAAAAAGVTDLAFFLTLSSLNLLLICLALGGLLYYLVYLFTGRGRLLVPLGVFYAAIYVFLMYFVNASGPDGIAVHRWSVSLHYAHQVGGWGFAAIIALVVGPQLLGALAYASLYFRVEGNTQRYRIALVSGSILVWFGSAAMAQVSGLNDSDGWQMASRAIGLAAAITIFLAYHPPVAVRRRFGVASIGEEGVSLPAGSSPEI